MKDTTFLFLFWGGTFSGWSQSERYHVSLSFFGGHLFRLVSREAKLKDTTLLFLFFGGHLFRLEPK